MTSFEFQWSKNKSEASGKALKTRKKPQSEPDVQQPSQQKLTPTVKPKKKKGKPLKESLQQESARQNVAPVTNPLIKRKQKKDKLTKSSEVSEDKSKSSGPGQAQHALFSVPRKNIYVNTNLKGKSVVEKVFGDEKKFSDLGVHRHLVSNLEKNHFLSVTNVQEKAIPEIMTGANVLIRAQTGSGKTLAYAVPLLNFLVQQTPRLARNSGVQAVIVVPTRELALQTHELFGKINTFQWIVVSHLCGGENRNTEKSRLRKGVHILIGTPGRLLDHISHTTALKINTVKMLILDEADRLLDMGFKKDIVKVVEELDSLKQYDPMALLKKHNFNQEETESLESKKAGKKERQTILLSATLTKGIAELADFIMKNHTYVDTLDEINPKHMIIPNTVAQKFLITHVKHRLFTLSAMLTGMAKHKIFVFMATSQMVDYHYELFTKYLCYMPKNRGNIKLGDVALLENEEFEDSDEEEEMVLDSKFFKLHGSMDQAARKEVFTAFRASKNGVLLCTDVAARGVDVPEADCIIQYTGPQSDEDYLHRVGRTGRAGKSGAAYLFLTHEEQEYLSRLQDHKVFLTEQNPQDFLKHLTITMEEPDLEKAATVLQRRYEIALSKDKELHRMACFAYSSWSRFYNTYPGDLRSIFNFKNVNLGHYVTSFGLKDTPSNVARVVKGQVSTLPVRRLNKKLETHHSSEKSVKQPQKRKIKSISLTTSEFSSGLQPSKKKKKK